MASGLWKMEEVNDAPPQLWEPKIEQKLSAICVLEQATRQEGQRRHGPDAGGGLPLKADQWTAFPEGPFAGSEDFIESQTWPLTPPTRVSSASSRAEDIPCLRSPSSFVIRQQQTPEERGTAICETQEELVEKLVKMAAMQINTSKAQFAASSERTDQLQEEASEGVPPRKAERQILGPRVKVGQLDRLWSKLYSEVSQRMTWLTADTKGINDRMDPEFKKKRHA
ncbi:unnamed protein product [Cladocopium goreaui]|uniref:Uncharacterized protein n=1 Tax=Cladocopium goreaui TaxID=2562237 RepID=A0A9P1DSY7_9DINO|nr:unnamed protein product [Cladocopium goreaui]